MGKIYLKLLVAVDTAMMAPNYGREILEQLRFFQFLANAKSLPIDDSGSLTATIQVKKEEQDVDSTLNHAKRYVASKIMCI